MGLTTLIRHMNKQSFCWYCGKKLKLPYFAEVVDPIGNIHIVHKVCVDGAKESLRPMLREYRRRNE